MLCIGEHLVFVMGDTYPKSDFLEQIDRFADQRTMLNGIRFDTDWETGEVIRPEWRTWLNEHLPWWKVDAFRAELHRVPEVPTEYFPAWRLATLNSLVIPMVLWDQMGGIPDDFDGYGKMDWYMGAWVLFNGYNLVMATKAIVYHRNHEERDDSHKAGEVFEKYLKAFIVESNK